MDKRIYGLCLALFLTACNLPANKAPAGVPGIQAPPTSASPTEAASPSPFPTATLSEVELLKAALENACNGQPAIGSQVGAAALSPASVLLCPDVSNSLTLPEEWKAKTAGDLQYVVEISDGTKDDNVCGPYTLTGQLPTSGSGDFARIIQPVKMISLIDVKTGQQADEKTVGANTACPQTIPAGAKTIQGNPVAWQDVQELLLGMLGGILPSQPTQVRTIPLPDLTGIASMAFSPDGKLVAAASTTQTISILEYATWKVLQTLDGDVDTMVFSPDGKLLAGTTWRRKTVELWDVESGTLLRTLSGHTNGLNNLAFSPDGMVLASADWDGNIRLWSMPGGNPLPTLINGYFAAYSPDGKALATVSPGDLVKLWDPATGNELHSLSGHTNQVNSVAFSPDGKWLASASSDQTIRIWDAADGSLVRTLQGNSSITSLAFSPDGKWLAGGGGHGDLMIWDATSGALQKNQATGPDTIQDLAYSPDGQLLAVTATTKFYLIELGTQP